MSERPEAGGELKEVNEKVSWDNRVGDRLPEQKRGRKKSGTAESERLSEDEMPN